MVGVLCNIKKEKAYSKHLHALLKPLIKGTDISVIVMCLPNINISEKTVFGNLITEDAITPVKTTLPSLIFNFAVQHKRSEVKKMRSLMEVENIRVINAVNQYNQWAIMEMLISNSKTKKYVLPYMNYNREDISFDFRGVDNFLVIPEKRANLSRNIYARQSDLGFDLYGGYGSQSCHRFDIQSVIHPGMRSGGKWLLLETPGLVTYKNRLLVIRAYMQKRFSGEWSVLLKTVVPQGESVYNKLDKKVGRSSLNIINCINCFIPDLGMGFIDFVIDTHGTLYFLNFGGWDSKLLSKKQSRNTRISICKNMLEYAEMLSGKKE